MVTGSAGRLPCGPEGQDHGRGRLVALQRGEFPVPGRARGFWRGGRARSSTVARSTRSSAPRTPSITATLLRSWSRSARSPARALTARSATCGSRNVSPQAITTCRPSLQTMASTAAEPPSGVGRPHPPSRGEPQPRSSSTRKVVRGASAGGKARRRGPSEVEKPGRQKAPASRTGRLPELSVKRGQLSRSRSHPRTTERATDGAVGVELWLLREDPRRPARPDRSRRGHPRTSRPRLLCWRLISHPAARF